MHKIQWIIKASNKDIKAIFNQFDSDKSGSLSNVEFKNAIRKLNMGLTSKDIDLLISYLDSSGDWWIDLKEFLNRFTPN